MTKKPALAAITLLSEIRDERSFHPIVLLVTDRHDGIRLNATEALGTLTGISGRLNLSLRPALMRTVLCGLWHGKP